MVTNYLKPLKIYRQHAQKENYEWVKTEKSKKESLSREEKAQNVAVSKAESSTY